MAFRILFSNLDTLDLDAAFNFVLAPELDLDEVFSKRLCHVFGHIP